MIAEWGYTSSRCCHSLWMLEESFPELKAFAPQLHRSRSHSRHALLLLGFSCFKRGRVKN